MHGLVPEVGARSRPHSASKTRHLQCYSISVRADAAETDDLRAATTIVLFFPVIASDLSISKQKPDVLNTSP